MKMKKKKARPTIQQRPCRPAWCVSPVSPRGPCTPKRPLGPPKIPQWHSVIPSGPSDRAGPGTPPLTLPPCMGAELWAEFWRTSGRDWLAGHFPRGAFSGGQMCRPASLKRARSGGKKWPRSAKKKRGWPPLLPGRQKFPYTFLLKRGVKRGHFAILSARLRRAKRHTIYTSFIDFQKTLTVIQRRNVGATSTQ